MAPAKRRKSTLLVAKLDRLSRIVAFIAAVCTENLIRI
jgi:DNA invertase Pin-like site-specific DNA recombinase